MSRAWSVWVPFSADKWGDKCTSAGAIIDKQMRAAGVSSDGRRELRAPSQAPNHVSSRPAALEQPTWRFPVRCSHVIVISRFLKRVGEWRLRSARWLAPPPGTWFILARWAFLVCCFSLFAFHVFFLFFYFVCILGCPTFLCCDLFNLFARHIIFCMLVLM